MNNRLHTVNIKISGIIIGAAIMIFPFSLLFGCSPRDQKSESISVSHSPIANYVEGEELLCIAKSEEEAREIAKMYGIEFVKYAYGVATFHTTEDPRSVIEMGKQKGYPELSVNEYPELY